MHFSLPIRDSRTNGEKKKTNQNQALRKVQAKKVHGRQTNC